MTVSLRCRASSGDCQESGEPVSWCAESPPNGLGEHAYGAAPVRH